MYVTDFKSIVLKSIQFYIVARLMHLFIYNINRGEQYT
ncbi:hypothetical protein ABVS_3205 [Acinetobacter lwoffii]|nr:hypothetical protein ABVS_3205 [Acinetobacter lwoffii]